jgi:hypothetical protein
MQNKLDFFLKMKLMSNLCLNAYENQILLNRIKTILFSFFITQISQKLSSKLDLFYLGFVLKINEFILQSLQLIRSRISILMVRQSR